MSNTSSHLLTVRKLTSFLEQTIGLLGKTTPESVVLSTRFGIHTFGMRFPIDVVILNNENQVVAYKKSLMPNRCYFWNPQFHTVLELPANTIIEKRIKKFDTIAFSFQ